MSKLLIAVVGALLNMILSSTVPCLLKKSTQPLAVNVRTVFTNHRQVILTSSVLVGVIIYVALSVSPDIEQVFSATSAGPMPSMPTMSSMPSMPNINPANLKYLSQLNLI